MKSIQSICKAAAELNKPNIVGYTLVTGGVVLGKKVWATPKRVWLKEPLLVSFAQDSFGHQQQVLLPWFGGSDNRKAAVFDKTKMMSMIFPSPALKVSYLQHLEAFKESRMRLKLLQKKQEEAETPAVEPPPTEPLTEQEEIRRTLAYIAIANPTFH